MSNPESPNRRPHISESGKAKGLQEKPKTEVVHEVSSPAMRTDASEIQAQLAKEAEAVEWARGEAQVAARETSNDARRFGADELERYREEEAKAQKPPKKGIFARLFKKRS